MKDVSTLRSNGHSNIEQREEIRNFMLELERLPHHADHVANLSLQLFDQLSHLHGLGNTERNLLDLAALLHDIGWSISGKKHHKHSMRLILGHTFQTLAAWEQTLTALIARYHRKTLPKKTHAHFKQLSPQDQERVRRLAALLRIADSLDRNKQGLVTTITCETNGENCRLYVPVDQDLKAEWTALEKRKDLFVKIFDLNVELVQSIPSDKQNPLNEEAVGSRG